MADAAVPRLSDRFVFDPETATGPAPATLSTGRQVIDRSAPLSADERYLIDQEVYAPHEAIADDRKRQRQKAADRLKDQVSPPKNRLSDRFEFIPSADPEPESDSGSGSAEKMFDSGFSATRMDQGLFGIKKIDFDRVNLSAGMDVFWQGIKKFPDLMRSQIAKVRQKDDVPAVDSRTQMDRAIQKGRQISRSIVSYAANTHGKDTEVFPGITVTDVAQAPENLSFSLTAGLSALMFGVPAALSVAPMAGPVVSPVVGAAVGTTAAGVAAFNMDKNMFLRDSVRNPLNAYAQKAYNRNMTEAEWAQIKSRFDEVASRHGLWEALPEAIGQAATLGLWSGPVKAFFKIPTVKNGMLKAVAKTGLAHILDLAQETAMEGLTQKGQAGIDVEIGARETEPTYVEAIKEVFPQVFLLQSIMGPAAGGVHLAAKGVSAAGGLKKSTGRRDDPMTRQNDAASAAGQSAAREPETGRSGFSQFFKNTSDQPMGAAASDISLPVTDPAQQPNPFDLAANDLFVAVDGMTAQLPVPDVSGLPTVPTDPVTTGQNRIAAIENKSRRRFFKNLQSDASAYTGGQKVSVVPSSGSDKFQVALTKPDGQTKLVSVPMSLSAATAAGMAQFEKINAGRHQIPDMSVTPSEKKIGTKSPVHLPDIAPPELFGQSVGFLSNLWADVISQLDEVEAGHHDTISELEKSLTGLKGKRGKGYTRARKQIRQSRAGLLNEIENLHKDAQAVFHDKYLLTLQQEGMDRARAAGVPEDALPRFAAKFMAEATPGFPVTPETGRKTVDQVFNETVPGFIPAPHPSPIVPLQPDAVESPVLNDLGVSQAEDLPDPSPAKTKKEKALDEYINYIETLTLDEKTLAGDLLVAAPAAPASQKLKIQKAIAAGKKASPPRKEMTFDEFKKEYVSAFENSMKYPPDQVGSSYFTEKMAQLAEAYPEWADKVESAGKKPKGGRIEKQRAARSPIIHYVATVFDVKADGVTPVENSIKKKPFGTMEEATRWMKSQGGPTDKVYQNVVSNGNRYSNLGETSDVSAQQLPDGSIQYTRKGDSREFTKPSVQSFDRYMDQHYFDWPEHRDKLLAKMDASKFSTAEMSWSELQDKGRELNVFKVGMSREDLVHAIDTYESTPPTNDTQNDFSPENLMAEWDRQAAAQDVSLTPESVIQNSELGHRGQDQYKDWGKKTKAKVFDPDNKRVELIVGETLDLTPQPNPKSGDTIRFTPHDKEFGIPIEGIVREAINNGDGFHVIVGNDGRVDRIWKDKGTIEILKTETQIPVEEVASAPTAKEKAAEAKRHLANAADKLKQINALFGDRGSISFEKVDEDLYAQVKPLLQGALDDVLAAGKSAKEFVGIAIKALTPKARIYFKRFVETDMTLAKGQKSDYNIDKEPSGKKETDNGPADHIRRDDSRAATKEDDPGSDEVTGAENVSAVEKDAAPPAVSGDPGKTTDGSIPGGTGQLVAESGDQPATRPEPSSTNTADRDEAPADLGGNTGTVSGIYRSDHRIKPGSIDREGGWKTAAKNNLDAVDLYKKILKENRPATKKEQQTLARYVGWGASELANKMFPGYSANGKVYENWAAHDWKDLVKRMLSVLTDEEIKTAAKSTQYAHYTSESIIRSIYKALSKMGFPGGKILEPGLGVGNFIGLLPDKMRKKTVYTGIEMDHISSGIAKLLYPNQNILAGDFTKQAMPKNFFDAAIGNPPFSNTKILADPEYRPNRFSLHNYFFAKAIDRVRPGGLLVFVTSRYTMDAKSDKARQYIADRADLLGAIRLPQTAFLKSAGTEVVTDVLFLQKREETAEPAHHSWTGSKEISIDDEVVSINEYFVDHPKMVLGAHSLKGSMYSSKEYTVIPVDGDIEDQFARAINRLPSKVYQVTSEKTKASYNEQKVIERDFNPKNKKEGGVYLSAAGDVMKVDFGSGVPVTSIHNSLTPKNIELLKDYIKLRDALKLSHKAQLEDGHWEAALAELNKEYDRFVKKNGRIMAFTATLRTKKKEDGTSEKIEYRRFTNEKILFIDTEYPLVRTLEKITNDGDIVKAAVLEGRTIKQPTTPEIKSVPDALAVSLDLIGGLDVDHVATLAKKSKEEVVAALGDMIYPDHTGAGYVLADEYLSGNVVRKLDEARAAAKLNKAFERNVIALEKSQPEPLKPEHITVTPGVTWIPVKYYSQFATFVLDLPYTEVTYQPIDNSWHVGPGKDNRPDWQRRGDSRQYSPQGLRNASSEWGTEDRGPNEIFDSVLNNRVIKITKSYTEDGVRKTYVDKEATAAANEIGKKIKARFNSWVWEDATRASDLLEIYNKKINTIKGREFDGSHLTLPGMSQHFMPYDHQKRGIWRIIQSGNTYLAHSVGAGKTFVMISAGMEMRRLGFINKPLYVVPNHMLGQFAQEFQELYPMANVLVADEKNFHTDNRKRFVAQAALNNPDAVILTHSSFGLLKVKEATMAPVRDQFLAELRYALSEMEEEGEAKYKIKRMENRIEKAEQRFDSMISGGDNVVSFEELGTDFLFLDEAHEFRKLDFITNRSTKGIDPVGSKRAIDLYIKTLWLEKQNPGRSHVFASGTPITNTLGELYSLMRFFAAKEMEEDGINHFDAWANMFGDAAIDYEMNSAGRYEPVERFSRFVNLPELMSRVRMFMDVLTSSQLGTRVTRPDIKDGAAQIVLAPNNAALKVYQDTVLQPRIKASKDWKPTREQPHNPDPIINIITDGKLASVDMRFVDRSAKNDPDSKLNKYIDGIIAAYFETKDNVYAVAYGSDKRSPIKGGAQICFYNVGFGRSVALRRGFDSRAFLIGRLKKAGIPEKHIAWIDDYNTAPAKQALFKDVRNGKKRILLGSAKKMGTGVNAQNRLTHLHYLDAPWYPADVEQPDGRIVRQGNQNTEVVIKRYATKGSYDATMWQMVARKSRFIEQSFVGDASVRSIEDVSETSQYEMAAALASGDERAIQLVGLRADIERLSLLKGAHRDNQFALGSKRRQLEQALSMDRSQIEDIEAIATYLPDYIGAVIDGQVGKKTYDTRKEFGAALKKKIIGLFNGKKDAVVGTINGVKIESVFYHTTESRDLSLLFPGDISISVDNTHMTAEGYLGADPVGLTKKITNTINGIPSLQAQYERKIEDQEKELARVKKKLGAPFEHANELAEKIAEAASLETELAEEDAAAEGEGDSGADDGPAFSRKTGGITSGSTYSLQDIRDAYPGREVWAGWDGNIWVNLVPGTNIMIKETRQINHKTLAFEFGYRGDPLVLTDTIKGAYHNGKVLLDKDLADRWTVRHEAWHALEKAGLINQIDRRVIARKIKSLSAVGKFRKVDWSDPVDAQEARAEFGTQAQMDRETYRGTRIGRILQKIADFIDGVINLVHRTATGVARDVESGKVFDREKSGTFDGADPNILHEKAAQQWHSAVQKAVEGMNFKAMPGKDLINRLKKTPGVKQAELDWMGIEEWASGKKKVSKDDVLAFIAENGVVIEEVVKGDTEVHGLKWQEVEQGLNENGEYVGSYNGEGLEIHDATSDGGYGWKVWVGDEPVEVYEDIADLKRAFGETAPTKFSQYTEPGGKNYKEWLLTLPEVTPVIQSKIDALIDKQAGFWKIVKDVHKPMQERKAAEKEVNLIKDKLIKLKGNRANFDSTHYDEPNIAVHIRGDERTGPNGEKVLHLAEIQSDWAQKGRKEGFDVNTKDGLPDGFTLKSEENIKFGKTLYWVEDSNGVAVTGKAYRQDVVIKEALRGIKGVSNPVPNMPYKQTSQWTELALKKMVRYAAENGFDVISWDTGDVQAARYDLSKQVDKIGALPGESTDNVRLRIETNTGAVETIDTTRDKLEDYVGKELAEKILNQPRGKAKSYSGLDLKVGGEGMKGFYDKILPSVANKFFGKKKWGGARVGKVSLDITSQLNAPRMYVGPEYSLEELKRFDRRTGEAAGAFVSMHIKEIIKDMESGMSFQEAADRTSQSAAEFMGGELVRSPVEMPAHALPITPEMKSKALREGMPLFQRDSLARATGDDRYRQPPDGPPALPNLKKLYQKYIGDPVWTFFSETGPEAVGRRVPVIDKIHRGIITDYRKDPEFIVLRDQTDQKIRQARETAKELARVMATFGRAEQIRIGQIIEGSVTTTPKRYESALKTVEEFKRLESDLQALGLIGQDHRFRQLSKKEIAQKFKEIGAIEREIAVLESKLIPITKVARRRSKQVAEAVTRLIEKKVVDAAGESGSIETKISKAVAANEKRVHEALTNRGFSGPESDTMIDRIKDSVVTHDGDTPKTAVEIKTTIEKTIEKTVIEEIVKFKTYSKSMMARARGSIIKEINQKNKDKADILSRIQTHYKMSGKQYLRLMYDTVEANKKFMASFRRLLKKGRLVKGYDIRRKDLNEKWKWEHRLATPHLVMKGLSSEAHDVELMRMFVKIAGNENWAISRKDLDRLSAETPARVDYSEFKPMPVSEKLGPLSGMMVDPYIYDDLNQAIEHRSDLLKAYDDILRLWKTGKVVYNPASQARNIFSGFILADMGDLPVWRVDIYADAARQLKTKGDAYKAAYDQGVLGVEWAGHEIATFLDEAEKMKKKDGSMWSQSVKLIKQAASAPGKSYQGIEQFFKLAMFLHGKDQGKTDAQAGAHAAKWGFDYTKIPPAIRWAKRWYSPFITFTYKAMPRVAEVAVRKPWKMVKYALLFYVVEELTRRLRGDSEDEVDREKRVLPDYMQRHTLPGMPSHLRVPITDNYGRSKYLDMSYILPWGDIGEMWGQSKISIVPRAFLPSHPMYIIPAEIGFDEIMFTGEPLSKDWYTKTDYAKTLGKEVWRQAMPLLAGSYGWNKLMAAAKGEKDWAGRDRDLPEAVFDVFLGLKLRSIDYHQELEWRLRDHQQALKDLEYDFVRDYRYIHMQAPDTDPDKQRQRQADLYNKVNDRAGKIMDKITELMK